MHFWFGKGSACQYIHFADTLLVRSELANTRLVTSELANKCLVKTTRAIHTRPRQYTCGKDDHNRPHPHSSTHFWIGASLSTHFWEREGLVNTLLARGAPANALLRSNTTITNTHLVKKRLVKSELASTPLVRSELANTYLARTKPEPSTPTLVNALVVRTTTTTDSHPSISFW